MSCETASDAGIYSLCGKTHQLHALLRDLEPVENQRTYGSVLPVDLVAFLSRLGCLGVAASQSTAWRRKYVLALYNQVTTYHTSTYQECTRLASKNNASAVIGDAEHVAEAIVRRVYRPNRFQSLRIPYSDSRVR